MQGRQVQKSLFLGPTLALGNLGGSGKNESFEGLLEKKIDTGAGVGVY